MFYQIVSVHQSRQPVVIRLTFQLPLIIECPVDQQPEQHRNKRKGDRGIAYKNTRGNRSLERIDRLMKP